MLDELSLPKVLPVGTIVFQTLFLLVAITIESYILHKAIKFDKKTSVFYAMAINVLSTVLGWNIFFLLEPILPVKVKSELMSYVFFNTFQGNLKTNLFLIGFVIFLGTFVIETLFLKILMIILREGRNQLNLAEMTQREKSLAKQKLKMQNNNLITTILIANTISYTAISLLILARDFLKRS